MHILALLVFSVLLAAGAGKEHASPEKAVEALVLHVQQGQLLLQKLEHQQRLTANSKASQMLLERENTERKAQTTLLQQEVQHLEAKLALQQKHASQARERAASSARSQREVLQKAAAVLRQKTQEANMATRRLCEALTEGRGDMSLLCREATLDMSPDVDKALRWLAHQQGEKKATKSPWTFTNLALLWLGWLVINWKFLRRRVPYIKRKVD